MGKGILISFVLHFIQIVFVVIGFIVVAALPSKTAGGWAYLPVMLPFYGGITQLLYMIPAIIFFKRRGQPDVAKGIGLMTAIGFLLNASCLGMMFGPAFWK